MHVDAGAKRPLVHGLDSGGGEGVGAGRGPFGAITEGGEKGHRSAPVNTDAAAATHINNATEEGAAGDAK